MEAARLGILARLYCLPRFNYYNYHLFVYRAYAYAYAYILLRSCKCTVHGARSKWCKEPREIHSE